MVGNMEIFKIILINDLKQNFKNRIFFLINFLYFLIFFSIIQILSVKISSSHLVDITLISVTLSLLISILANCNDFLRRDFLDGTLEQLLVNYNQPELIFIAKICSSWIKSSLIISIFSSFYIYFNSIININFFTILIIFLILSFGLTCLISFSALVAIENGLALVGIIIALPLSIPLILISQASILDDFYGNIFTLLAVTFISLVTTSIAGGKLIRIINQ